MNKRKKDYTKWIDKVSMDLINSRLIRDAYEEEFLDSSKFKELFNKDFRWTKIWEMIKARIPISVKDRDYFVSKLK